MDSRCRIELFGGLRVTQGTHVHTRFRTQKAAALLAYLAQNLQQAHSREQLIELFWSDMDTKTGRDNLSTALAQLRRQLEPAGTVVRGILQSDWQQVRLNSEAVTTDVGDFENLLRQARRLPDATQKIPVLQQALEMYRGELLPGNYADWVESSRNHYQNDYYQSLVQLISLYEAAAQYREALDCAERALVAVPFDDVVKQSQARLLARLSQASPVVSDRSSIKSAYSTKPGKPMVLEARPSVREVRIEPVATPPVASLPAPTLPLQLTRFYGREQEQEQICRLLESPEVRLVTLLGLGGVGKTRLSIEVAAKMAGVLANRVWFVSLAGITRPEQIPAALTHALHLPLAPPDTALERTAQFFAEAPALLVLDNLEQLVHDDSSATTHQVLDLFQVLLQQAPNLTCLITSRIAVGLGGESIFGISPLPLPPSDACLEGLQRNESIALYHDRARAVRTDFAISAQNAEPIIAVCRLLEGIPLAIEMAAAWVRTIPPQKMRERLEQKMDLLVSRRRDLPTRHQSLHATIEWSYDLLSPALRTLFARLAIFRRGWSLDAAEFVCGEDTIEGLRILQEHSLILCVDDDEPRYRLLEPLREFAETKLASSDDLPCITRRHAEYFSERVLGNRSHEDSSRSWFDRLERDHDNLRAAFDYLLQNPDSAGECLTFATRMQPFWQVRGYFGEGRERLQAALRRTDAGVSTIERARATHAAATLAIRQGDYRNAEQYHHESLILCRSMGDSRGEARALVGLGAAATMQRHLEEASVYYNDAKVIYQVLQDNIGLSDVHNDLGNIAKHLGDLTTAESHLAESLSLRRQSGDSSSVANVLTNLAPVVRLRGDLDRATEYLTECLLLCRALGNRRDGIFALHGFAEIAEDRGDWNRTVLLYGAEAALRKALGARRSPAGASEHEQQLALLAKEGGEANFQRVWNTGMGWTWEESVAFALGEGDE